MIGLLEQRDRLVEPARFLVVDPEIRHRHLRIRLLAAELGFLPLEHVLEQRHGFVELLRRPVRLCKAAKRGQGVGVVGAELGDPGVADALEQGDRLVELAGASVSQGELIANPEEVRELAARLVGLFEQRDRFFEPAGVLVVDPEVGHG